MTVVYILLAVAALLLLIPMFISKEMNYKKSVSIDAPPDQVWAHVGSLTAMDQWSPWNAKDPNMKRTLEGTDGEVGARQSWLSDKKDVGEGSQTIVGVDQPNRLLTKLEFIKPFKSEADAFVQLEKSAGGTIVTWGFESKMPYPMNIMKLFMNFEKSMDADFGTGLNKLRQLCESKP